MAGWVQVLVLVVILAIAYRPLGDYMAWALSSKKSLRVERFLYRLGGVNPDVEQRWTAYAISLLAFSVLSVLLLYVLQRVQASLPLSLGFPGVKSDQAFNTAISFVSNTNWQSYAGESTMGHLVQMAGLAVQNFVSAAVGIAVAVALIRGFTRRQSDTIGNFWADLVRSTIRILLPIALVGAVVLVSQGVVQNFNEAQEITTVQGATQSIPGGPVASQEVIKELGTNGGGFYNANSAHPFENPNPFTNLLEIALLLMIPFALTGTFGKLVGNRKQGYVLAAVMGLLWMGSVLLALAVRVPAQPAGAGGGRRASRGRQHGRQGGSFRRAWWRGLRRVHDRHLDGFGQHRARFDEPVRGRNGPCQHHAVGGISRWRGLGALRHPRARDRGGLHRRAHGGSHARIPGQEDRAAGDETGLGVHLAGAVDDPALDGCGRRDGLRGGLDLQSRAAWSVRSDVRLHVGSQQQRQRLRWVVGEHDLLQHGDRFRDVVRPVRLHRAGAGCRRFGWHARSTFPSQPERSPPPPPCSWGSSSA